MKQTVLTFDFGASSGRAILVSLENGKLEMQEVHRFDNTPFTKEDTLFWDIDDLWAQIKTGISNAAKISSFSAIGIDTWGVDFGLLDTNGDLLQAPMHYRDTHTIGIEEKVFEMLPKEKLYAKTGIQTMHFNSIFQLYYLATRRKDLMDKTDTILFMPDLFAYFLTGAKRCEYTIASTSQMLDAKTRELDDEILQRIGVSKQKFAPRIECGEQYGLLKAELAAELGCDTVPVIAVATHDTASAVVSVPAREENFTFVSCGTWSLMGTELSAPVLDQKSCDANITNEGGYAHTIRYLKNIIGLWLYQESVRQWKREGISYSHDELTSLAEKSEPFACLIDPDNPLFEAYGDLPGRIREYCKNSGQAVPQDAGAVVRCIYESLALKYRKTLHQMQALTGKKCSVLHMVGGGTKAKMLCRFAANACGIPVVAGPVEATALGNAAVLMIALGYIKNLEQARQIIGESMDLAVYQPETDGWDAAYERFLNL